MTLPRELRDQICKEVILSQLTESPDLKLPSEAILEKRESYTRHRNRDERSAWTTPQAVKYLSSATVTTSTPLLLINHQLHAETMENLKTIPQAHTYDLDLIVLEETYLCPTWLRVPALTKNVDVVNVKFRIAGTFPTLENRYNHYIGFRGGDGGGPAMAWQIYDVLDRFLKLGPVGERETSNENKGIILKTLDIDVQTPPDIDPSRFKRPRTQQFSRLLPQIEGDSVLDPKYLVGFISGQLSALLGLYRDWADYGSILYESMDEIIVRHDGKEVWKFDVASLLQKVQFHDSFSSLSRPEREPFFVEWKKETVKLREQKGLKVVYEED